MGRHGKNNAAQSKPTIPQGIVADRRAGLKNLRFTQPAPAKTSETQPTKLGASPCTEKTEIKTENAQPTGKLNHLTRSRPSMPHRRLPSKKGSNSFKEPEKKPTKPIKQPIKSNFAHQLQNAIANADQKYREYYQSGDNARKARGWFSWARHGKKGQIRAETLNISLQKFADLNYLVKQLDNFFSDPDRKYNNHSFAAFLLDELNLLLETSQGLHCRPSQGKHYDSTFWPKIKVQFEIKQEINCNQLK